jgi:hypothetical protein
MKLQRKKIRAEVPIWILVLLFLVSGPIQASRESDTTRMHLWSLWMSLMTPYPEFEKLAQLSIEPSASPELFGNLVLQLLHLARRPTEIGGLPIDSWRANSHCFQSAWVLVNLFKTLPLEMEVWRDTLRTLEYPLATAVREEAQYPSQAEGRATILRKGISALSLIATGPYAVNAIDLHRTDVDDIVSSAASEALSEMARREVRSSVSAEKLVPTDPGTVCRRGFDAAPRALRLSDD